MKKFKKALLKMLDWLEEHERLITAAINLLSALINLIKALLF